MRNQPFTIMIHLALAIILVGAFVTHFCGIQGSITLYEDAAPVNNFQKVSGNGTFPFSVSLVNVMIDYYPSTTTPMDFRSILLISESDNSKNTSKSEGITDFEAASKSELAADSTYTSEVITVAMNKVVQYKGWRFYQSGIGVGSSTLSVSHDPWGTGITYTGYALLGIGMIGFFFQRKTIWRARLRQLRKLAVCLFLIFSIFAPMSAYSAVSPEKNNLPVMQRPLAANLSNLLVYWNDRICPLQTLAYDVTATLYGGCSYKSLTPEQVLSGWLFYYDKWEADYLGSHPELKSLPPYPISKEDKRSAERLGLIRWLGTGEIFKIFPYLTVNGNLEWLSLTGRKPSGMNLDQWTFMQTAMPEIEKSLLHGENNKADSLISRFIVDQNRYADDMPLPSEKKIQAEIWYNRLARPAVAGLIALIAGLLLLASPFYKPGSPSCLSIVSGFVTLLLIIYVGVISGVLWWISGHIPLSNGPETMIFMGFAALLGCCFLRDITLCGALLIISAMSLFVAAMGGRSPRIGALMPVLSSPLLSIHVMLVMISYVLFFLMTILAILAVASNKPERKHRLTLLNKVILTPSVFLLGAGIFIGAVWANQTWGRYWGWDPKETCALIMWLVYALPLHKIHLRKLSKHFSTQGGSQNSEQVRSIKNDKVFNWYLIIAILTVLFTYFGANYFLPGLHSYA